MNDFDYTHAPMTLDDAVDFIARAYHGDHALKTGIINRLVKAGIIDQPVTRDPRAGCPAQRDIKAFKMSLFDNGPVKSWRGKTTAVKREFGLEFHVWTTPGATVRKDGTANWKTTMPLWDKAFAEEHCAALLKKKQIDQATYDHVLQCFETNPDVLVGIGFSFGKGSGWLKGHVVAVMLNDRKPDTLVFWWPDGGLSTSEWTDKGVDGKALKGPKGPIHHARIAFNIEHADWCNDVRYGDGE